MVLSSATAAEVGKSEPIITKLVSEDKKLWLRKPNLRYLYFMLFPTCMGIELTSGFDSQMINALQIVPAWIECTLFPFVGHLIAAMEALISSLVNWEHLPIDNCFAND